MPEIGGDLKGRKPENALSASALQGALATGLMEPVYCGTSHPGLQSCIFAPSAEWVMFNFNMRGPHVARVGEIATLLERLHRDADDLDHGRAAAGVSE